MQLLIKNALIAFPTSPHDGEKTDLLISDGKVERIGQGIQANGSEAFDAKGACLSPGWLDIGTLIGDPGFEHREDFRSATQAAAAGGYTALACFPNTFPEISAKSEVLYVRSHNRNNLVEFLPIGAISQECKGKDLTEMQDMYAAGAVAFSDGKKSIQDGGLMMRALQYVRPFEGVILNHPYDKTISPGGQMNESIVSTSLGMKGFPDMAEELMLQRDLHLVEYTGGRLHFHNISTAGSVRLVREAKRKGLRVTASVAAMNLGCDDGLLLDFDSNFKVMPPLREHPDIKAIQAGLKDGTIDCITSNHTPLDEEAKNLEFPFADFGAIGLETAFALSRTHTHKFLSVSQLVEKFALGPRRALGLPLPELKVGASANFTIFDPDKAWTFTEKNIRSKSRNTPFLGWQFRGRALAVVRENQWFVAEEG